MKTCFVLIAPGLIYRYSAGIWLGGILVIFTWNFTSFPALLYILKTVGNYCCDYHQHRLRPLAGTLPLYGKHQNNRPPKPCNPNRRLNFEYR